MEIVIENNVITEFFGAISSTFTGLLPLLTIMISIPVAFYVLRKIIMLFPRK